MFEGCRLEAYKCVPTEAYYTIGYGHYGADVKKGMKITQHQAEELLRQDLQKFVARVQKYDWLYHFNQNQFDALVSFAYNVGSIDQLVNYGKRSIEQIANAIPAYNKSGGRILQGLVKRRYAEQQLFTAPCNPSIQWLSKDEVVKKVLAGDYGVGAKRKACVEALGFDYKEIQSLVNKAIKAKKGQG